MALYVYNALSPLGEFDVLDTDMASITGGEIMTLDEASIANSSSEKAVSDVLDGYIADGVDTNVPTRTRVVARIADTSDEPRNLFYLADDGVSGYGTMLGKVVGGTAGLVVAGTSLGPSTMTGSGKVTLWDKAGLYGVSLGSVDADVVPSVVGGAYYFDTPLPGELLYRSTAGKLTRNSGTSDKIARFVELAPTGSLVTTPPHLVGGSLLNSFSIVKIQFLGVQDG